MPSAFSPSTPPHRRQQGAIAVELAIVTTVMLLIVAGTIGFGRVFWYADALTKATRDGARLMSSWPAANINSAGVSAAQILVRNLANAAGVSPSLTVDNVQVECLDTAFAVAACVDGTRPDNVRVSITGFTIRIGQLVPIIGGSALLNSDAIGLTPHTTMRSL
ncbi:pilus assembly protein [Herbaspirillum sp. HC18]|nr:pilus assembly protein [Herbaspirillum sp. HC18]